MKKYITLLITVFVSIAFIGCTPNSNKQSKSKYDDDAIIKIETVWVEGMAAFHCEYVRAFDFETGRITDMRVADNQYVPDEFADRYNNPTLVSTFDATQWQNFISEIKALGILAWEERYETTGVHDSGNQTVTIYFADGTEKSTYICLEKPSYYEEIQAAFIDIFGVCMYAEW